MNNSLLESSHWWDFEALATMTPPVTQVIVALLPQSSYNGGIPALEGQVARAHSVAGSLPLKFWIRVPEWFGGYPSSNIGTLQGTSLADLKTSLAKWNASLTPYIPNPQPRNNVSGILTLQEQKYGPPGSGINATSIAGAVFKHQDSLGVVAATIGTTVPGTTKILRQDPTKAPAYSIGEFYEPFNNNHKITFFGCDPPGCACCTPSSLETYGCPTCSSSGACDGTIYGKQIAEA